ncbi:MAG TPA: serine/threonine-protein kinase [Coleofasciculaceae cyanobacterium]
MNNFPNFSPHGYQIVRVLGHNRAGGRVTYLATSTSSQQRVVIKQFQFAQFDSSWADYDAYEREINVLRSLSHPGIPHYLDSFETATGFCLAQEYKPALSLASPRYFTSQDVKKIAIAVLELLVYLQQQNPPVIHRDIKPDNILVDYFQDLKVYLVDFGFARLGGGDVSVSSVVKGTLGFMPPEQLFNRQLTEASDLYSLGITLICLLTQTPSTDVGNLIDETYRLDFKTLLPKLNPPFVKWLEKMIAPSLRNRFPNAATALNALKPTAAFNQPFYLSPKRRKTSRIIGFISLGVVSVLYTNVQAVRHGQMADFEYSSPVNTPSTLEKTRPVELQTSHPIQTPQQLENREETIKRLLMNRRCSGCDLRHTMLGGANLWSAGLMDANLEGADLRSTNLWAANLERANLKGVTLTDANLLGANLKNTDLSRANLRNANLKSVNLRNANLAGADLRGSNLENAYLEQANLRQVNLQGVSLNNAKLKGAIMPDGSIHQ